MPSIGETGWGQLVSNNFAILDTILNTFNTQIDTINTNIGDGTRILSISSPNSITITSSNFSNYASYSGNNVYIAQFVGNTTFSSIPQPPHSCRLMIIFVNGNATFSGNINTYPTTLQSETPPDSETTNTYDREIIVNNFSSYTLTYTANANNSQITMDYNDYLNFLGKIYTLSIPHAIAAGGRGSGGNGKSGTATNTCNGGGGGATIGSVSTGGTGCIFGQYANGTSSYRNGYGYGDSSSNKYRCGLVIIAFGNLTLKSTIAQNCGGSYGGGGYGGGGGGAPVFIYYTGTYTNNGTINTAGAGGYSDYNGGSGGAGGIKVTKITI